MAKTVKKETKTPKTQKVVVETTANFDDEPILVNEKNEIIFDPEAELEKITKPLTESEINLDIDDDIKEGIEYLKNNNIIPNEITEDINATQKFVETKVEELTEIKNKLNETPKPKNFINFSSFWNGATF